MNTHPQHNSLISFSDTEIILFSLQFNLVPQQILSALIKTLFKIAPVSKLKVLFIDFFLYLEQVSQKKFNRDMQKNLFFFCLAFCPSGIPCNPPSQVPWTEQACGLHDTHASTTELIRISKAWLMFSQKSGRVPVVY